MIDIKDRICDVVADKVMSAEAAAEFVKDGDNLGQRFYTVWLSESCSSGSCWKGQKNSFQS